MALKFKCEKCGADIAVKYLKPGEEALCRDCGDTVTFPDYAEAEKKRRLSRFVPCPACGSDELKIISFWSVPWFLRPLLRRRSEAVPVKCKKCGARFDGLTGRSVDDVMDFAKTIRFVYIAAALFIVFSLTLCAFLNMSDSLARKGAFACERKADALYERKEYEEALKWYERGLVLDPEYFLLHCGKANTLRELGRYEEALEALDRAIKLEPDEWLPPYGKAEILVRLGRYEEALEALDRAIKLEPDEWLPPFGKAEILVRLGRLEEAVESYDRALKFADDESPRQRNVTYSSKIFALQDLGKLEEALKTYDEALTYFPEDGYLRRGKARLLIKLERYDDLALSTLSPSEVNTLIVNERKGDLDNIYGKYLEADATLEGKIVVRFKVAASGTVTACSVDSSTLGNAAMEREVCGDIMTWRFPPGEEESYTIICPLTFKDDGTD